MPANFQLLVERNIENFLLRRWITVVIEVIAISAIFSIIVWNPTADRTSKSDFSNLKWKLTGKFDIEDTSMINKEIKYISYIPGNQPSTELVQKAAQRLQLQVIKVPNEKVMETKFNRKTVLCGVVFDNQENYPKELSVRLRFSNELRSVKNIKYPQNNFWEYRVAGDITDDEATNKNLSSGIYMREGFLQLQHAIFQEWIAKVKPEAVPHNLDVAWFMYPKDHKKRHILNYSGLISLLYHFAFCFSFCNTVYLYARKWEKNMFPHLWRYGYSYSKIWYGNIFITVLKLLLMDLIITLVLYMTHSEDSAIISFYEVKFGHFMLFLILYNLQYLVCAIFYAVLMQNGKKSVLLALVIWFATYGCFTSLLRGNSQINNFVIIILLIAHFNNVFPLGMTYLYNHLEENPKVYWILIECMLANIFLYLFLVSWIQYLQPGLYMKVYQYNFLYWRNIFCNTTTPFEREEKTLVRHLLERTPSMKNFEYGPLGVEGFVKLRKICTRYKLFPDRNHLKNISMTLFKGEITIVWGHHSSGKTSLICLLAGWQIPEFGSIKFDDLDLHNDWNKARKICDVSMPNNSLYDNLTVRSTLDYFIGIKLEIEDRYHLQAEVHKWLEVLKPVIKNHNLKISALNFDQKRLLCLCIVLSCETKIILLDGPTQRMRLQEKYLYWNILRAEKRNRVIILTTCSLDEANYIGDRIALLDNGKILAYGTPYFLKTSFSDFYYLVINKYEEAPALPITHLVLSFIPEITVEKGVSTRIVYKVPTNKRPLFQLMLINIEKSASLLGIHKIQMLTSTLNEVAADLIKDKVEPLNTPSKTFFENRVVNEISFQKQVEAMIFKKTINQMPNLLPASMVLISLIITAIIGKLDDVLPIPQHNSTKLGLLSNATERTDLPRWNTFDCSIIRIKDVKKDDNAVLNSNIFFFHKDAYTCHKEKRFEKYLSSMNSLSKKHLAALQFNTTNSWTLWLNKRDLESGPVTLNLAHNLILQEQFPSNTKYYVKISNDPFLIGVEQKMAYLKDINAHLLLALIAGVVIPFMASCFIIALIEERHSHMWVIQRLAGLHLGIYWVVTFFWDWLTFILFSFMFIIVQVIMDIEDLGYMEKIWIYLLIVVYGLSALGWIYIMSMFMQKSKTVGFFKCLLLFITTGIVAFDVYWDILKTQKLQTYFGYIFQLSPHFEMLFGISSLYLYAKIISYCEQKCDYYDGCVKTEKSMCLYDSGCCASSALKIDLQSSITCIIFNAILSFGGIFIISVIRSERNILTFKKLGKYKTACYPFDDTEVTEVREKVSHTVPPEIYHKTFVVDQLEYHLPNKPGQMHTISFEANKGQCIAIYGNQRSGISRLARLLSGIDVFRFGSIFVEGVDMKSELLRSWNYIAYCPPNRGLYNNFTPRELMIFLALISGVSSKNMSGVMYSTFRLLKMGDYVNKKCGQLSVEKQRKVNIAAAIIIFKSVLIIDQPTNGIPLWATQEIWNALHYLLQLGRTIIFTTDAIKDCRVLVDKMLIYERGEMLAYGGFYYLLGRYTKGIFLEIKLNRDADSFKNMRNDFRKDVENLYRFVSYLDSGSEICTRIDNCLCFYLPIEEVKYSALFGSIEKNKIRLNISDYTINQGSIEEIIYTILKLRPHLLRITWH